MTASFVWEAELRERLGRGDPVGAVDALVRKAPRRKAQPGVLGAHALAASRIFVKAATSPLVRLDWALRLIAQPDTTHRSVGAYLLAPLWEAHADAVEGAIVTLAESEDWVSREDAASAAGAILDEHFRAFLPRARQWMRGRSPRLRRAAILAAKRAGASRDRSRTVELLDLLEPALRDADPYVRKNLGPFAIGDGFLRAYPEATLTHLERWAMDVDENVRWNVAMAFSAAEAARHVEPALRILAGLVEDERRSVWRAAASALRNLARRRPAEVRATLLRWRDDPRRKSAAETAIALAPAMQA